MTNVIGPQKLKEFRKILLGLMPPDGVAIGNKALSTLLIKKITESGDTISDDDYWVIRNGLIADGKIDVGRGKGGSVYLSSHSQPKLPKLCNDYKNEKELYGPILKVIEDSWAKDDLIDNPVVQITANLGSKAIRGKWSRPDLTLVAIRRYEFIPGKTIELVTFEVKTMDDFSLNGVFETASHLKVAHRSYLMIQVSKKPDETNVEFSRLKEYSQRFEIGVILFDKPDEWETYETIVAAIYKSPEPSELSGFIAQVFYEEKKAAIRKLI